MKLCDDKEWYGGWYQPIEFPDGTKTVSTKNENFFEDESLGIMKWNVIKEYLPKGKSLLDIGCNAGLYMILSGFKELYGIESSPYFKNQCKHVLKKFGVKARISGKDALEAPIPKVDVAMMINTLYWVGFTDEEKEIKDREAELDKFIKRLSEKVKWLFIVGSEDIDRIGGSLEKTLPLIERHFKIKEAKKIESGRALNVIVAYANRKTTKKAKSKKRRGKVS